MLLKAGMGYGEWGMGNRKMNDGKLKMGICLFSCFRFTVYKEEHIFHQYPRSLSKTYRGKNSRNEMN